MMNEDLSLLQKKVTLLRSEGKYKETIESCYYLLKSGVESNDYKSILTAHINTAVSYYCIGDIEEAFKSIELYDKICSNHGDDLDKLNLYNTLFIIYEYNKDFYKAKETLKKSIALGKKLEKYNMVSNGYSNYSHVLIGELNYMEALTMGEIGLEFAKLHKPESTILEIRVKLNIAAAHIGLKDFNRSKILIEEIINYNTIESFPREKAQCYMLQGEWYSNQDLYVKAFESLTYAKEMVKSYNDIYILKEIEERRCELCELMNDSSLGYKVQREYISLLKQISEKELAITALKLNIKHNIAAIERKANTDYLTGLYNRSYLETTTNEWLNKSFVEKENIACIVFDIDNFKSINDRYGHLLGDTVIKQIGNCCSTIIREEDLIARYGGDEFVIILRRALLKDGKEIAERVKRKLANLNIKKDGNNIPIRVSIGVADNANNSVVSFKELFHLADMNLYKAKENGKNQIYAL